MIPARLHISGPLAGLTSDRFELLLTQGLVLRDLDGFIDAELKRRRSEKD